MAKTVPEENPLEKLAREIEGVSAAAKRLFMSRLTERAIICLLYDSMGTDNRKGYSSGKKIANKTQIRAVLRALPELAARYLKKRKKKGG